MKKHVAFVFFMTVLIPMLAGAVPFSQYGQIKNVQNYSSNPFWTTNSAYNQRAPQAVRVQGTDLTATDCQNVISILLGRYCAGRNNCIDDSLDDVRPAIIVQLSQMPNRNYVGSCAGYLDTEFERYSQAHFGVVPTQPVNFPNAGAPVTDDADASDVVFKNPYASSTPPQWLLDMKQRDQELKDLQAQNGSGEYEIVSAEFPMTVDDLSYTQRMENAAQGYAPYKGNTVYKSIKIEDELTYLSRVDQLVRNQRKLEQLNLSKDEYCKKYPDDKEFCEKKEPAAAGQ